MKHLHLPLCAASGLAALLVSASGAVPLVACSAPAAELRASTTSADAIASARRALGWDRLVAARETMRVQGKARILGTDAEQTILFDAEGRHLETVAGPMAQSSGRDGAIVWARDWSGTPRVLTLGDRAQAELERLFMTGAWTLADDTLRFEHEARREGDELVLEFEHRDGVIRGSIRLDASTMRPRSATYASDSTPTTWRFESYADHDGFAFPSRVEYETEGHAQRFETIRVERARGVAAAEYAPRIERPRDARFDRSAPAALEVKVAKTGHVLVHPLVNGKDLGWFIFDTGAGTNCIANDVTKELGTEPFGEIAARGVGGSVAAHFWRARELQLGPITVDAPMFMGLDLAFLEPHFGVKVGGILGFEFLARCVAEIDMKAGVISIHEPGRYTLPAGAKSEELLLYGRHPCVRALFDGHEGVFRMDTGAAQDTVTFHYQATADLRLAEGRETSGSMAGGVGGSVKTNVGEMKSFVLGGRELGPLSVSFALEDTGAFADDYTAGNIGGKLLEPFRMVFDYPGGKVGFVPRE